MLQRAVRIAEECADAELTPDGLDPRANPALGIALVIVAFSLLTARGSDSLPASLLACVAATLRRALAALQLPAASPPPPLSPSEALHAAALARRFPFQRVARTGGGG